VKNLFDIKLSRAEAIKILKDHELDLKRIGVRSLYMFGSTSRDEAEPTSDVDLFFDYERGEFSLFDLMDVQELASRILGRSADIMTRDSLHPVLRRRIEASALRVF
jgi:predicted nucleotidyltransferase